MLNLLALYLSLFLFIPPVQQTGQDTVVTIRGSITDAVTGETLPSAHVIIEESYTGTISNLDGNYTLTLSSVPATVTVRYIGYHSETRVIDTSSELQHNFNLEPASVEMDEIVITDQDPALSIMERVIARKAIWRSTLENYSAEAYTRQALENDTSIVTISESISNAYWDAERGHREVVTSRRRTSNLGESADFTGVSYMPNLYDDDIEIAGFRMIGPTHPDALTYYHFTLVDRHMIDDRLVYEIEMEPRRRLQPAFTGTVYVLDREFALLEVQLKPNEVVRFPPPVNEFDLSYEQQFSNYGGDYWLPVDIRISGLVRVGMVGLRFPSIRFRQVSRISNYEVNTVLPDSLYDDNNVFSVDSTSIEKVNLMDTYVDRVPLTVNEEEAYQRIDSTATLEQAFRPTGFLARAFLDDVDDEDENREPRERSEFATFVGNLWPNGASLNAHFNRVDGYHVGIRYDRSVSRLQLHGRAGYNTHSGEWDYGAGMETRWLSIDRLDSSFIIDYNLSTTPRYHSKYLLWMNSLTALAGGEDYFDYYNNEQLKVGFDTEISGPNLETELFFLMENHRSADSDVFNYSLFNAHKTRRDNPAIDEGRLHSVALELGINGDSDSFGITGNRSALIRAEYSDSWMGSDFDFSSVEVKLAWNTQTFYQRRLLPNTLDVQLSAGSSAGYVPLQRRFSVDGSMAGFTPFGVLKTRRYRPYEGDQYWLFYAEHNFRTVPFEILGLHGIADKGWSIILFAGAGEARVRNDQPSPDLSFRPPVTKGVHSEAGISLNSIFGVARLDFAKRLDAKGFYIGISLPRYF